MEENEAERAGAADEQTVQSRIAAIGAQAPDAEEPLDPVALQRLRVVILDAAEQLMPDEFSQLDPLLEEVKEPQPKVPPGLFTFAVALGAGIAKLAPAWQDRFNPASLTSSRAVLDFAGNLEDAARDKAVMRAVKAGVAKPADPDTAARESAEKAGAGPAADDKDSAATKAKEYA